jgi:hypothetical protein
VSRGRALVLSAALGLIAAVLLGIFAVRLLSQRGGLGDATFDTNAAFLAGEIAKDGPVLFQDLAGGSRDIYVQHLGDDPKTGWYALKATAPGAPRRCTLTWDRAARVFRDTRCGTGATFPEDGTGLERFQATVPAQNRLVVDFRTPIP